MSTIKLEKISHKHKDRLVSILNKRSVEKWLSNPPFPYTPEDAEIYARKCEENKNSDLDYPFAIELDGIYIGGIVLHRNKTLNTGSVGYYLDDEYWGKGYATIALEKILKLAFEDLKLKYITASVFIGNTASEKLLIRCGFKFKEFKTGTHKKNGKIFDTNLFVKEKNNNELEKY